MSADIRNDPEFQEWEAHVSNDVVPKMQDSAMTVQLFPNGKPDIKFAVELGLSILLDKPIIVVCEPGSILPDKMLQVADRVVEVDWRGNPTGTQEAIADAITTYLDQNDPLKPRNA